MSQPNAEQLEALRGFKSQHSWQWKDKLRTAWETGMYPHGCDSALLQQVRNQFGPRWLNRVKL